MLKTNTFEFDRKGRLTLFVDRISHGNLMRIIKVCVVHARRKKTRKPVQFRIIPTLA